MDPPQGEERGVQQVAGSRLLAVVVGVAHPLEARRRQVSPHGGHAVGPLAFYRRNRDTQGTSYYYNKWPAAPVTQVTHVRMCQAACSSHTHTAGVTNTYTASTHTHRIQTTNTRTNIRHTHTARQDKGSDTLAKLRRYVSKHNGSTIDTRAGKNTHACAHTATTLAQVRRYVFKHNGSVIDTRTGKNTHARTHTAATLPLKHKCSAINTHAG